MTGKKKARMNFQLAVKLVNESILDDDIQVESLVDACKQCGFLEGHEVRTRDELPNPRKLKHLSVADVIDLNNRQVRAVAQALFREGITKIEDLLDKKPQDIFDGLKVSDKQKLAFVVAIESAGVRFTPATKPSPSSQK